MKAGIKKQVATDDTEARGVLIQLEEYDLEAHSLVYHFAASQQGWNNERMSKNITFEILHRMKNFKNLLEQAGTSYQPIEEQYPAPGVIGGVIQYQWGKSLMKNSTFFV